VRVAPGAGALVPDRFGRAARPQGHAGTAGPWLSRATSPASGATLHGYAALGGSLGDRSSWPGQLAMAGAARHSCSLFTSSDGQVDTVRDRHRRRRCVRSGWQQVKPFSQHGTAGSGPHMSWVTHTQAGGANIRREPAVVSVAHLAPIHLGLDVHKDTISVGILDPDQQVPDVERITHDAASVRRLLARFPDRARLRACYQAGPTGFELARLLHRMDVRCEVIAPSLIPRAPGDKARDRPAGLPAAGPVAPRRRAGRHPHPHRRGGGGAGPVPHRRRHGL
jgi:hypothetical protein